MEKINSIKILNINRIEYERDAVSRDDVKDMLIDIKEVKKEYPE